jgi:hypothetical protein
MSLTFNGTSSKLTRSAALVSAYGLSIFAWIKPVSTSEQGMVCGHGDNSGGVDNEFMLYCDGTAGKVKAFARDSGSASADSTTAPAASWQPALATFTSTTRRDIYYAAGAVTNNTSSIAPSFAAIDRFIVGCRGVSDSLWFDGDIAEVAIWSSVLTQGNFDSLAAGAFPETIASGSLIDAWSLETQAASHTGVNGNVLTAANTTQGSTHPFSRAGGGSGKLRIIQRIMRAG